jgi:hypothetical protein
VIGWLRLLGVVVLAAGIGVGGWAGTRAAGDVEAFAEVTKAYERHPEHPLFQAEFYAAAAKHYGLLGGAVAAVTGGVVVATVLLALAAILARQRGDG